MKDLNQNQIKLINLQQNKTIRTKYNYRNKLQLYNKS